MLRWNVRCKLCNKIYRLEKFYVLFSVFIVFRFINDGPL